MAQTPIELLEADRNEKEQVYKKLAADRLSKQKELAILRKKLEDEKTKLKTHQADQIKNRVLIAQTNQEIESIDAQINQLNQSIVSLNGKISKQEREIRLVTNELKKETERLQAEEKDKHEKADRDRKENEERNKGEKAEQDRKAKEEQDRREKAEQDRKERERKKKEAKDIPFILTPQHQTPSKPDHIIARMNVQEKPNEENKNNLDSSSRADSASSTDDPYLKRAIRVGQKSKEQRKEAKSLASPEGMQGLYEKMRGSIANKSNLKEQSVNVENEYQRVKTRYQNKNVWLSRREVNSVVFEKLRVVPSQTDPKRSHDIQEGEGASAKKIAYVKQLLNQTPKQIELGTTDLNPSDKAILSILEYGREVAKRTGNWIITFENCQNAPERAARIEKLGKAMGLDVRFDGPSLEELNRYKNRLSPSM